jgi:hypothetical protein
MFFCGTYLCWSAVDFSQDLNYTLKTRSIMTYGVQVSSNGTNWRSVSCGADPCTFDTKALASQPDDVVENLFPHHEEARFVKILLATWEGMQEGSGGRGGDMRLGILGVHGGGSLSYRVSSGGVSEEAWLQLGCSVNRSSFQGYANTYDKIQSEGRWAALDAKIGEVQCCLSSPGIHVCTRDGCLSGNRDAEKFTWHEANSMCQAQNWRLCRREELSRDNSAGCCTVDPANDKCGYNIELVWTSHVGGLQPPSNHGRIHSKDAIENVKQVMVDLDQVQTVRGVQIQGGVSDPRFYGPACFLETWYYTFGFYGFGAILTFLSSKDPVYGSRGFFCGMGFCASIYVLRLFVFANDPAVPGFWSKNPICPLLVRPLGQGMENKTFKDKSFENVAAPIIILIMILIGRLRPQWLFQSIFILGFALVLIRDWWMIDPPGPYVPAWGLCLIGFPIGLKLLQKRSRMRACNVMQQDILKYDKAWEEAGGSNSPDIGAIKVQCKKAKDSLEKELMRVCSSPEFPWWKRLLFRLQVDALGPYSRDGKLRQRTADIDQLFQEVIKS